MEARARLPAQQVPPATIVVYGDIACPWSHVAVHRLHETRSRLGLEDEVRFDHRAFPLELFNSRPTPKAVLDAEIPVAGALAPDAGWQMWQRQPHEYAVSTLLALEAVQAAKEQGALASERLDLALRVAFFGQSRNISLHHEIWSVAAECEGVDADALGRLLEEGRARRAVFEQKAEAERVGVQGSPHLFLPNGEDVHNPGVSMRWVGRHGVGFPVVDEDDPRIYERLLWEAAGGRPRARRTSRQ